MLTKSFYKNLNIYRKSYTRTGFKCFRFYGEFCYQWKYGGMKAIVDFSKGKDNAKKAKDDGIVAKTLKFFFQELQIREANLQEHGINGLVLCLS